MVGLIIIQDVGVYYTAKWDRIGAFFIPILFEYTLQYWVFSKLARYAIKYSICAIFHAVMNLTSEA